MRLVSWNIHAGVGLDGKRDLNRIAQELLDLKPDILCLQEVSRRMPGCALTDQPAILAKLCDMCLTFGAETKLLWYAFGNAILTRYPIISTCRHPLPNHRERIRPGLLLERRGALEVTLNIRDLPLSIFSTHWSLRMEDRTESAHLLGEIVARIDHPVIVAGDFNAIPISAEVQTLSAIGNLLGVTGMDSILTFPAYSPSVGIDLVLARGVTGTAMVVPTNASDHCMVCVDF